MNGKNSLETMAAKMVNGGFARIFLVLLALSLTFGLQAQKEQKILVTSNYTADRSAAKKYRDGQALKDVEVRINDMTTYIKTDKQGIASVNLLKSANQYRITSIEKKNYELAGAKNIYNNMQLYQADEPLRLIMVSTADKDRVVSRLRKEIDSLRTENKRLLAAKERTDSAFFKVEEDIERLESSIFDRALEYLGRNLSLLDSANLEAQLHIMEGNYEAAEQALPNIYELITMYKRLKDLHKASIQTEYNTFETYITAFTATLQFDSAAHYAMMKADRYENDIQAQFAAGSFLKDFACNYDLALKYYNRALHIAEANNDSLGTANSYYNLAMVYCELNNSDKALELFNRAEYIWEGVSYRSNDNLARLYNGISKAYLLNNKHYRALEYSIRALMICENASYRDNDNVRLSYFISGMIYLENGDADRGAEYLNKALSVPNATWGDNSLIPAQLYNIIGDAYAQSLKTDKALEYYAKVLNIYETVLPENHTEVINLYLKTGDLYVMQDESDKALEYYNKALHIRKNTFGDSDITVGYSYYQIGLTYADKKEYDKALEYMDKALNVLQSSMIINYSYMAAFYRNLAEIYSASGNIVMAKKYNKKATKLERRLK